MIRCVICKKFSLPIICKQCQNIFLKPNLSTRILPDGFKVYSFYKYSDIEELLKTKHTYLGSQVFKILSVNSFREFAKNYNFSHTVYALAIDDHVKSGYSHTALLACELSSATIKPIYNSLRSMEKINYSGKSLDYRLKNPRNFKYSFKSDVEVILVDDIVTTGTTILQAKKTIKKHGANPLFALCLADAKES